MDNAEFTRRLNEILLGVPEEFRTVFLGMANGDEKEDRLVYLQSLVDVTRGPIAAYGKRMATNTSDGEAVADVLSRFVNGAGGEQSKRLVDRLLRDHRTLQQSLMGRVIMPLIRGHAKALKDDNFDLRNEDTVRLCGEIVERCPRASQGLPLI
jgi:hypothetical protein